MKRTQLKRTAWIRKPSKRLNRVSKKNSKPHEDLSVREQYRREHRSCLLCGLPSEHIHHIHRGCLRVDIPANLAALCGGCHGRVHDPSSRYAAATIEVLYRKLLIGEFDPAALDAIGGERLAGWLSRHKQESGLLLAKWNRLSEEFDCG